MIHNLAPGMEHAFGSGRHNVCDLLTVNGLTIRCRALHLEAKRHEPCAAATFFCTLPPANLKMAMLRATTGDAC
jgi:hypothetical protein